MEEAVIRRAKRYAGLHETSVSAIVEKLLDQLTTEQDWQPRPDTGQTYEDVLTETLEKKYGSASSEDDAS